MLRPEAIWVYTPGTPATYTNYSQYVSTNVAIPFLSAALQYIYIGTDRRSIGIYADLSTVGNYTGVYYEFLNASENWVPLAMIDSYTFNQSKYGRWVLPDSHWVKKSFTSTFPYALAPPDSVERYWIRISCSACTTQAIISKLRLIPFTEYATFTKVSEFLELKNDFSSSTRPTDLVVENMIRRAEDRIDYRTRKSWRFNPVTETADPVQVDFNRFGMFLRHRNFYKVYSVQMWNGGEFITLSEGRSADYQINYNLGIIYLTRQFLMPAVYGMSGRYNQWDVGEYKNAVQVDYAYGRDSEYDAEFYDVEDVAIKMVAINILRHSDYTVLAVSGSDRASIGEKIQNLESEIEMSLDELTGVSIV